MKMKFFLITAFASFSLLSNAQSVETSIEYNKGKQPAATVEYPINIDIVEDVIKSDLKNRGFGKGKSTKGFTVYEGIIFNEISTDKIDLYIKSDKKSKKDKANSIVTAMVSKGYDNFMSGTTDPKVMAGLITYLNNLKPKFDAGNLEVQIKDQEDVVKKEEKRQNNITDDISDMEKKIKNIQDDIVNKKNDLEKQKSEVEKQRQILTTLKTRKV